MLLVDGERGENDLCNRGLKQKCEVDNKWWNGASPRSSPPPRLYDREVSVAQCLSVGCSADRLRSVGVGLVCLREGEVAEAFSRPSLVVALRGAWVGRREGGIWRRGLGRAERWS